MILAPWLWRLVHSRRFRVLSVSTPLAGLVLFYAIANVWGARKLDQARKDLSAKGYALTWAEVIKSGVAPEEDLLRHEVMARKPPDLGSELVAKGYDQSRIDSWIPDSGAGTRFSAARICGRPEAAEAESIGKLTADLDTMEPTASEIKEAVRSSKGIGWKVSGVFPLQEDPSIATVGWMREWMPRRAALRAAAGDMDGTMDDLKVIPEYLGLLHTEPRTLFSWIIERGIVRTFAVSILGIARMPSVDREQLLEMGKWLETLDMAQTALDCYRREIVFVNEAFAVKFGRITASPPEEMDIGFSWMDASEWWPEIKCAWKQVRPVGLLKGEVAEALLGIDREIIHHPDGSERQYWTLRDVQRIEAFIDSLPCANGSNPEVDCTVFEDFLTGIPSLIRGGTEIDTILRLCRTGIAAELYRRDHGRPPTAMGDLVPAYLAGVPVDALAETPLRMETNADGGIIFAAEDKDPRIVIPAR